MTHDTPTPMMTSATTAPARWISWVPPALAAVAATSATLVLIGWAFDVDSLRTLLRGGRTAMNPATALSFLASALAITLLSRPRPAAWVRVAGRSVAAAVFLVATCRLGAYAGLWQVRPDGLLFASRLAGNQMAPNTAMAFASLSSALLLLDVRLFRGRFALAQPLLLATAGIALLSLVGYLYEIATFYGVRGRLPMSLNAATQFLLLAVAGLCARPDREPVATLLSPTFGGVVARRLLPAAFAIPLTLGALLSGWDDAQAYGPTFAMAVLVLSTSVAFAGVIWWCARAMAQADLLHQAVEAKAHASEQRYRAILEQAAEGIYLVDLASRSVVDSNNAFDRLLGYPTDGTIGLAIYDLVSDSREHVEGRLQALAAADGPLRGERMYRRRDGTNVEVDASASVIDCGGHALACTVVRDITARKRAEREMQEKSRQLQAAYQAEQDAREQLQRAQSQLVQNEKLAGLGQTVAGVAHEINNPLSFVSNNVAVLERDIRGLCELLALYQRADELLKTQDAALALEIAEQAERVDLAYTIPNIADVFGRSREGLRRIQQIVKDLRDFARLDEGDPHDVDLNDGVASTVNIVQGRGKTRRVTVGMELGELPRITCHPAKLNQVVMNLVANAIDASPEGGHVSVRTAREGDALLIEVADNGNGVPEAIRGRIFDPFFTTKPQGEGTGLGLSISYGIVRDHGGTITVGDAPTGGALFTVRLPASGAPVRPPAGRPHNA